MLLLLVAHSPASNCSSWSFQRGVECRVVLVLCHVPLIPLGDVGLLLYHILLLRRIVAHWSGVLRTRPGSLVVEGGSCHGLKMQTHCFRLLEDPVQTVNEIVMILVTLKDIETGQDEFVLFLDEFVQQLDVIWITEMVSSKTVHIVKQLVLLAW
jgi:hypothetical protein